MNAKTVPFPHPAWLLPVWRVDGTDIPKYGFVPKKVKVGQVIYPSARIASQALGMNPSFIRVLVSKGRAHYVD